MPSSDAACHTCGPSLQARRRKKSSVIETLNLARRWQERIDKGQVKNAAQIASEECLSRARVSQIMAFLRLAPPILDYLDDMNHNEGRFNLNERSIRRIVGIKDQSQQIATFEELIGTKLTASQDKIGHQTDDLLIAAAG